MEAIAGALKQEQSLVIPAYDDAIIGYSRDFPIRLDVVKTQA